MNRPEVGKHYRHFKGGNYEIVAIATHTETGETLVIYKALYGEAKVYARPLEMFVERVDPVKYPDATQEYRFERVDEEPQIETEGQIDPRLLMFLDARGYREKLEVLEGMRDNITDSLIDAFAVASDLEIKAGRVEDLFDELRSCLMTRARFECDRLRR